MLGRYQGQVEKSEKGGVIATRVNEFIFRVLKAKESQRMGKTLGAKQKSVGIGSSDENDSLPADTKTFHFGVDSVCQGG